MKYLGFLLLALNLSAGEIIDIGDVENKFISFNAKCSEEKDYDQHSKNREDEVDAIGLSTPLLKLTKEDNEYYVSVDVLFYPAKCSLRGTYAFWEYLPEAINYLDVTLLPISANIFKKDLRLEHYPLNKAVKTKIKLLDLIGKKKFKKLLSTTSSIESEFQFSVFNGQKNFYYRSYLKTIIEVIRNNEGNLFLIQK